MKVPVITQLDIHAFSGSGITEYEAGMTNVVPHDKNGTVRATQRPSIDVSEDSSTIPGLNDRGRGIYYWELNSKLYIVHDDSVYANSQNTLPIGTISSGSERIQILETIGVQRMVILDAENNEGWVMTTAEVLAPIASFFPATLVHGGLILDSFLLVMDEEGLIYNSEVDDPTNFPATGFIKAERDNDKGVFLGAHHDNAVAFGTRTVEFFWNARNTSGSPLNRRQDIFYNIGCASGTAVWENGDKTYFVGSNPQGQLAIYKLESFQIQAISTDTFSSYLTEGITQNSLKIVLNGISAMGNDILLMTVYIIDGTGAIVPKITISFDVTKNIWGFWKTEINGHSVFPLIAWTKRTGGQNSLLAARTGEGIFHNGDIISMNDNLIPIDTRLGNSGIYDAGIYDLDIYSGQTASNGVNIPITIRTGLKDGETLAYKFQAKEAVTMESTKTPQTITIKHSDEIAASFDAGNTVDTSLVRKELWQGGRFIKRNYQLEYNGDEQIFIENLDVELQAGL